MSDNNAPGVTPIQPKAMTGEEVKQRAQRILDHRGPLPWQTNGWNYPLIEDEAAVLSEFVQFWMPYLTIKEKKNGPQEKP